MVEEKIGVQNGTPNGDMPPQEESQKAPLTEGGTIEPKAEMAPAVVDTKVDVGNEELEDEEFRGLTKEDLMKYSKDPFWSRLRIFLMVFFWLAWVAMLVLAILIIIQAPQCEAPPSLKWLQESPILQVDIFKYNMPDVTSLMAGLGLTSFYVPSLISPMDYYILDTITYNYRPDLIDSVTKALSSAEYKTVTDFVPNPVHRNHPYRVNQTYEGLDLLMDQYYLQYNSTDLEDELKKVFEFWRTKQNVTGFLVSDAQAADYPDVMNFTNALNAKMETEQIVVGTTSLDISSTIDSLSIPGNFKEFVMENYADWHYYQFNPMGSPNQPNSPARMNLVTLSLMLLPGTPVLKVESELSAFNATMGSLITSCVELREKDPIKFGETQFVNTTDNVLAFSRTMKGTPGYVVAVNLGDITNSTETVDFKTLKYVPETGTIAYTVSGTAEVGAKVDLREVEVAPHEGIVIQFVADYNE